MNFTPLGNRVLVKQKEAATRTPGGILLPENAQRKPLEGEVVAVGPGGTNKSGQPILMNVTVGDQVLIAPNSATKISVEGNEYFILTEDDILGILD
jgi:chaperonin GroES